MRGECRGGGARSRALWRLVVLLMEPYATPTNSMRYLNVAYPRPVKRRKDRKVVMQLFWILENTAPHIEKRTKENRYDIYKKPTLVCNYRNKISTPVKKF